MSVKRRGIILAICLLTLATVSLAATVQLLYFQLPDPEQADGPGLIRWMVLRDLSQEPPEVRRRLLIRVQQVLVDAPKSTSDKPIDEQLDPKYRPQFWSNVNVLLEEWFYQQAELYEATPAAEQTAQLDKIIDGAKGLSNFKPSTTSENNPHSKPKATDQLAAATELMQQIKAWIERAPVEKKTSLRHFAAALQTRMAARTFQQVMQALGS